MNPGSCVPRGTFLCRLSREVLCVQEMQADCDEAFRAVSVFVVRDLAGGYLDFLSDVFEGEVFVQILDHSLPAGLFFFLRHVPSLGHPMTIALRASA